MTDQPDRSNPDGKRSLTSHLMWWQTDEHELEKQVAQYDTLTITQSARGTSMLCCVFSVAVTTLFGSYLGLTSGTIIGEAAMWSTVAFFMWRGHQWAFIAGMVLWTLEKGLSLTSTTTGGAPIVQFFWWAAYMSAFMLAFRVERRKAALTK